MAKIKKLRKSVQDDTHAKSEADTWVRNHAETIERVAGEMDKMDASLEREEAELDRVRDGLKGEFSMRTDLASRVGGLDWRAC